MNKKHCRIIFCANTTRQTYSAPASPMQFLESAQNSTIFFKRHLEYSLNILSDYDRLDAAPTEFVKIAQNTIPHLSNRRGVFVQYFEKLRHEKQSPPVLLLSLHPSFILSDTLQLLLDLQITTLRWIVKQDLAILAILLWGKRNHSNILLFLRSCDLAL